MTNTTPAAAPATLNEGAGHITKKVDSYLVSNITAKEVNALLLSSSRTEMLSGSFMVTVHANAAIIERSPDGNSLPFKGTRFTREGHVPVTLYGAYRAGVMSLGYLVNDPPEPGVRVDDLDDNDRARVRGER